MSRRKRAGRSAGGRAGRKGALVWIVIGALVLLGAGLLAMRAGRDLPVPTVDPATLGPVPEPDVTDMEPRVVAALAAAREAVAADPTTASSWGRYGIVCDAHDLYAPAADCYRAAALLDPSEFRWPYFLGRVLEILGAPSDSIFAAFEKALAIDSTYVPAQVRFGDSLARGGQDGRAQGAYEKALALDPDFARAHRGLGISLLALGDAEGARDHLLAAARLDPEDGANQAALARALARTGDRAGAREAQQKAKDLPRIKAYPDAILAEVGMAGISADACLRRAAEFLKQGRLPEAARDLEIAIETRSEEPAIHARLAHVYSRSGRPEAAIRAMARAVELDPDTPERRIALGDLLLAAGRREEALARYREANEIEQGTRSATVARMGSTLAQLGRIPEALAAFERAESLGELESRDYLNWGTALAASGDPQSAVGRFERAAKIEPRSTTALFNWGLCLERLGHPEEAAERYRQAAALDPRGRAAQRLAEIRRERGPGGR